MSEDYSKNFGMFIPTDVVRRPDGRPALFIKHKKEFLDYLVKEGRLEEVEKMTWEQRDDLYKEWEKTYTP